VGELLRVELAAIAREQHDERALGDAALHALVLADLGQLEPRVTSEQLLVVLDVVRVGRAQAPDGEHDGPHCAGI
jgi:hypothetical protein